jgi:hypothetical protein
MILESTQVGFFIPKDDLEEFDKIAYQERTSRAALLRKCVLEKIHSCRNDRDNKEGHPAFE